MTPQMDRALVILVYFHALIVFAPSLIVPAVMAWRDRRERRTAGEIRPAPQIEVVHPRAA